MSHYIYEKSYWTSVLCRFRIKYIFNMDRYKSAFTHMYIHELLYTRRKYFSKKNIFMCILYNWNCLIRFKVGLYVLLSQSTFELNLNCVSISFFSPFKEIIHLLSTKVSLGAMVLILDGNSEIGAYVRSNLCCLMCLLRQLFRSKVVTNRIFV